MVDKTTSVGANTRLTPANNSNTRARKTESKPNSIYTEANNRQETQNLKPVEKPKPKKIEITVGHGDNLGSITERYNTSLSEIMELNNLKDPNKLKEGQKLIINTYDKAELEAYTEYQNNLSQQEYTQARIQKAESAIDLAKELGYTKDYDIRRTTNGDILLIPKAPKELGQVRSDFQIPPGSLSSTNDIKGKYEPQKNLSSSMHIVNNYDKAKVPAGDTLLIKVEDFNPNPSITTWDRILDNFF